MAQCGPGSTNINTKRRKSSRDKGKNCRLFSMGNTLEIIWGKKKSLLMGKVQFLAWHSCDICDEATK